MTRQSNGITERLVDYALGLKHEEIPPEAVERAKQLFLDFLGDALGGRALAESNNAVVLGARDLAAGARGDCTVLGDSALHPPHLAAMLNGAFAHSMDFDDTHREAVTHPGTPLFATLMALGEQTGVSGREFLAAAIVGYDVGCKLAMAHGDLAHRRGFHPTATTGIFACTMAGGRLMKLGREELLNAVALNLSQSAGSAQFSDTGGSNKPLQVGLAAHNAIYSLAFARHGFQGSPRPLEGRFGYFHAFAGPGVDLDKATAGLGKRFEVLHTAVKPYPCCRYNHPIIDGVLDLMEQQGLEPGEVQSIRAHISEAGYQLVAESPQVKRAPATIVDGQFSAYFAAAVAAVEKRYAWESYQRLRDPQVVGLMQRVAIHSSRDVPNLSARVAITAGGQEHTLEVPLARGEPERPLSWAELEAKFEGLWAAGGSRMPAATVVARVRELDQLGRLSAFTRELRG
jgi:2-methylcitrate dehydratase PrpD